MSREAEDLFRLEAALQAPSHRRRSVEIGELLDPNFREFGSSGVIYSRGDVLAALQSEADQPRQIEMLDKEATQISASAVLLTYTSLERDTNGQEVSRSLRSSLWRYLNGRWTVVFHQGTKF